MNIKEIKGQAKEIIKTNKWNIWKPVLFIALISFLVSAVVGLLAAIFGGDGAAAIDAATGLLEIALVPMSVGLYAYNLKIVRNEEFSLELLKKYYPDFLKILVMTLIISICTILWSLLFIIPGIIAGLSYSMALYICVDKPELGPNETVQESKHMMYGYKMDYFIMKLSFLGWMLLVPFTLGILFVWLYPYMIIADALFYEKVKEAKKNK